MRIGYVVETPVWKTSYRLLLDDKGKCGKLQGWAIVENQTDSDWNDVPLSLVSGRPISFMMDLYQPLYVTRPIGGAGAVREPAAADLRGRDRPTDSATSAMQPPASAHPASVESATTARRKAASRSS